MHWSCAPADLSLEAWLLCCTPQSGRRLAGIHGHMQSFVAEMKERRRGRKGRERGRKGEKGRRGREQVKVRERGGRKISGTKEESKKRN